MPQRLVVVGAGYIGLELGIAFRKLGAEVTVVEAADRILPSYDEALTRPVRRWLRARRQLQLGAKVTGATATAGCRSRPRPAALALDADKSWSRSAAGRRPRAGAWRRWRWTWTGSFVKVDDQCRTSMRDVWAIGDLVGEPMLAHKAMAQGEMVAEIIAGQRRHFDPASVAAVVFTEPEIVVAGMSARTKPQRPASTPTPRCSRSPPTAAP